MKILRQNVLINSRKIDGEICKSWNAELLKVENSLLIFRGVFDREIKHRHLGIIRRGTISYEFYWLDKWYNVFKFYEPDKSFRNFYCNINMPPKFENDVLDYVDLDIDVIVWSDFSQKILDIDDFENNSKKYGFSSELKLKTDKAVSSILQEIENRVFPFDSLEPY